MHRFFRNENRRSQNGKSDELHLLDGEWGNSISHAHSSNANLVRKVVVEGVAVQTVHEIGTDGEGVIAERLWSVARSTRFVRLEGLVNLRELGSVEVLGHAVGWDRLPVLEGAEVGLCAQRDGVVDAWDALEHIGEPESVHVIGALVGRVAKNWGLDTIDGLHENLDLCDSNILEDYHVCQSKRFGWKLELLLKNFAAD
ncbi:hypothetical protein RRF57_013282 [Xylaria bambusicola]|uniref:Uncharacterized protein n=1 Tax=Xylaria bambusicola TaxID=326684 RepID=A0AAN7ZBC6_9PEZI